MGEHAVRRKPGIRQMWQRMMRGLRWRTARELAERWSGRHRSW